MIDLKFGEKTQQNETKPNTNKQTKAREKKIRNQGSFPDDICTAASIMSTLRSTERQTSTSKDSLLRTAFPAERKLLKG